MRRRAFRRSRGGCEDADQTLRATLNISGKMQDPVIRK
jgi:hypothetical protein